MQIEIVERKFGSLIQLTLDDGSIITAPCGDDDPLLAELRMVAALRVLASNLEYHLSRGGGK